jgi:hypothetical protein
MKTLKISIVATLAALLAWKIRLPHRVWPTHPQLASFLIAIAICVVLQVAWTEQSKPNQEVPKSARPENMNPKPKSISRIN